MLHDQLSRTENLHMILRIGMNYRSPGYRWGGGRQKRLEAGSHYYYYSALNNSDAEKINLSKNS